MGDTRNSGVNNLLTVIDLSARAQKKTNKTSEKRRNKCEGGRGETLLVFSCFYFLKRCISIRLLM